MRRRKVSVTRYPNIYQQGGLWRVQVGKKNFTFHGQYSAEQYAGLHYFHGTNANWQLYCYTK